MVLLILLGLLDIVAGILIIIADSIFLPQIANYIGIILLLKGVWSMITGWRSF